MYTELIIGGETYKLRLNTRASIQLEKALGCNPMNILIAMESGNLPKLNDVIIMLQAMLQCFHHGYNTDKTIDLFDKYVDDGKSMLDLLPVFIEVFQKSGYISEQTGEEGADEKN